MNNYVKFIPMNLTKMDRNTFLHLLVNTSEGRLTLGGADRLDAEDGYWSTIHDPEYPEVTVEMVLYHVKGCFVGPYAMTDEAIAVYNNSTGEDESETKRSGEDVENHDESKVGHT